MPDCPRNSTDGFLFDDVIAKMGAAGQDFVRIAERRTACTGGLWSRPEIFCHASDPARTIRRYRFGLKTLDAQAESALALLGDLVFAADPRDRARLEDVVSQARAYYRTRLVNDGSGTVEQQASRGFSARVHSPPLCQPGRALRRRPRGGFRRARRRMCGTSGASRFLTLAQPWIISFTGSVAVFGALSRTLEDWGAHSKHEPASDAPPAFQPFAEPPREGLAAPMLVAHCAKAMPAPHLAHPDVPLLNLGLYLARFDYMLPEIRLKGNAYGAGVRYSSATNTISLSSFRDPKIG